MRCAGRGARPRQPDLLVLDEATSALDTENERSIRTALHGLRRTMTVLTIAYRLSTVSDADTIYVIDAGRIVESGTWTELADLPTGRLRSLIAAGALRPDG